MLALYLLSWGGIVLPANAQSNIEEPTRRVKVSARQPRKTPPRSSNRSRAAAAPRVGGQSGSRTSALMRQWERGRFRGANAPLDASAQDLRDLAGWGANLVRVILTEEAINPEPPYELKESGLKKLDGFIRAAESAGLKVVVGFRIAPGRRAVSDRRIWEDPDTHLAFADAWRRVAGRHKSNPAIAAFDLLSEPNPELLFEGRHPSELIDDTTADWNLLAKRLTLAIREVDTSRPLIVEASAWGYARGFEWLKPTGDPNTIYSFHMFSPHKFTHQEPESPLPYPGVIPAHVEPEGRWDARVIRANLHPATLFQKRHNVPIFVGEFGTRRTAQNAADYLKDLLILFEESGWHWAFWQFRGAQDWNPEFGPSTLRRSRIGPEGSPLLRLYREFFSLNDHPTYLQDLPLLKDESWVEPMRAVHRTFTGEPGTVGLLGDSITFGQQFMVPMFETGWVADPKTLEDLQRFRDTVPSYVAGWKREKHGNLGGWRVTDALPGLPEVLLQDNPEVAVVMFGTNDLNGGMPEGRNFEENLGQYIDLVLANGTVPILSTIPPRHKLEDRVTAYNEVIRRVAKRKQIPLMDYYGAIIRRRPNDWYRNLIIGDGIHPSFPDAYRKNMVETEGLRNGGFTLRNYLALQAILSVLDRLRAPEPN